MTGLTAPLPAAPRLAWARHPISIAFLLSILLLAVGEALSPGFAAPGQIISLLTVAAFLGLVAAGQTLVILGGREGIDLSVGGTVSLGALIAGNLMQGSDAMLLPALLGVIVICGIIGAINGVGVTLVRLPPLVMTLGMYGVIQGLLVLLTRGRPSGKAAPMLLDLITAPVFAGIPGLLPVWALIAALLTLMLTRTSLGYAIYALGSNELAARFAGVPTVALRIGLYAGSGMLGGITGFLLLGYTGTVFVGVGDQYVLPSIIAVVIGGTSLAGGAGSYLGTVAGAILLTILQSLLTTLAIDPAGRQMIFGATLLGLMLLYGRRQALRG